MFYTIVEIAIYLVVAALLGFWLGSLFRGRRVEAELAAARRTAKAREKEFLGVWQRKLADCERQSEDLRATTEKRAAKKAALKEAIAKQTTDDRPATPHREPTPAGKSAGKSAGKPAEEPARQLVEERTEKPANKSANDKPDDEAARQRVKTLVERASGELAHVSGQLDRETARKQVKALVQRVSGGKKPPHDNLKKIYGIGPKFEKMLNELGITSYQQVAGLTADDIKMVAAAIEAFPDRVERDNWVEGAIKAHRKKYGSAPG